MAPELSIPDPPLAATSVTLRPWRVGDAERLRTAADDPLVRRYRASVADLLGDPEGWITAAEAASGRGRGLGLAAVATLARWAFEELGMERLAASIEEGNAPSRRLAERCGFQLEGRLRSCQRLGDGTRVDCLSYSVLLGELRPIN